MYLKRLVIHGFKSFGDKTVLELEQGVTGIVGPNGCGKSNVADAIKWVLGEQSPKSLRASSMQDVLFEGADTRAPMAFAEVSLLFTDCEKELGTAFHEVEVGRRVERDGGSDYFINGKSCRLKDIQQLFRDTGIGRVAYSFLQQGQIDKLLSANPLDRRTVFEEAAGISGFKVKHEETLRKLGEVETNLARLSDILSEVTSQMGSLKRQAAKAARAQRLRKQLNALDQSLMAYDLQQLHLQIEEKSLVMAPLEKELQQYQTEISQKTKDLGDQETRLTTLVEEQQDLSHQTFEKRSQREEALSHVRFLTLRAEEAQGRIAGLEETLAASQDEKNQLDELLKNTSQELQAAKEQVASAKNSTSAAAAANENAQRTYEEALLQEVEARSTTVESEGQLVALQAKSSALELESHGLEAQMAPLNAQKETLLADEARTKGEMESLTRNATTVRENLKDVEVRLSTSLEAQQSLREKLKGQREKFDTANRAHLELIAERNLLEELNRRYEGFNTATQALLQTGDYAPLVEGLQVASHATAAISALLAVELEAVIPAKNVTVGVERLVSGERVALPSYPWGDASDDTAQVEGLTRAIDLLEASAYQSFLKNRLAGCYVCSDAEKFESIVNGKTALEFVAVANLQGAMIDCRGLYTAAHVNDKEVHAASYLTRSQRLQKILVLANQSEEQLQTVKHELTRLDHAVEANENTLAHLRQESSGAQAQLKSFEELSERLQTAIERMVQQRTALEQKTLSSQQRLHSAWGERDALRQKLQALAQEKEQNETKAKELAARLGDLRQQADAAASALSECRLAEANTSHQLAATVEAQRNQSMRLQELTQRMHKNGEDSARLHSDVAQMTQEATKRQQEAKEVEAQLEILENNLETVRKDLDQQGSLCSGFRKELEGLREKISEVQGHLMRARLEMGELQSRQSVLNEDSQRRWGNDFNAQNINWREGIFLAQHYAKGSEESLQAEEIPMPSVQELEEAFPQLVREELMQDTKALREKLENIGPVNESALEDYQAHEARYGQMKAQSDDLHAAKTELTNALEELQSQSSTLFAATFEKVRANFAQTFEQLFGGGKADLQLSDPNDVLSSGIEIMARPPGTQLKALNLLSGGQKTMTAVALLFAIYQVKPSPFCVLDELDAPLDDANIGRFLAMLKSFTQFSQFVIITHNKRTMASCNILYGVTMQERGVSKIISMRLSQAETYSKPTPAEEKKVEEAANVAAAYSLETLNDKDDAMKAKIQAALRQEEAPADADKS